LNLTFDSSIATSPLLALHSRVGLTTKVGGSRAGLGEEAGEDWLDEGAEDDLSSTSHWEGHPEDEHELENVVEWEPVDGVDNALNHCEESIDNPVGQPLCVINLACTEQCLKGVIARNDESRKVDQELAANVEENQEEVETDESEEGINLWDGGLLLKVVEGRILGKFLIDLGDLVLGFVLERHDCSVG